MSEFVQQTWNISEKYTDYLPEKFCQEIESSFPKTVPKFSSCFISLFKNFCGGGANEDMNAYDDENKCCRCKYENFDISVISFKDIYTSKQERIHPWMLELRRLVKKLDNSTSEDIVLIELYLNLFFKIFNVLIEKLDKNYNIYYNIIKKTSLFLSEMIKKRESKEWKTLIRTLSSVWVRVTNSFTFLNKFETHFENEMKTLFGKPKTEQFIKLLEIYHFLNFNSVGTSFSLNLVNKYTQIIFEKSLQPICISSWENQKDLSYYKEIIQKILFNFKLFEKEKIESFDLFLKYLPFSAKRSLKIIFLKFLLNMNSKVAVKFLIHSFLSIELKEDDVHEFNNFKNLPVPLQETFSFLDFNDIGNRRKFAKYLKTFSLEIPEIHCYFQRMTGAYTQNEDANKRVNRMLKLKK